MDGLDHLTKLLAIVKSDGLDGAFSEGFHDGGWLSDVKNVNFQAYQEPLCSMRRSLEEFKLCMSALNTIKSRLAGSIRDLQKRCKLLVLEDGIKRIPDEILAQIFEAGHRMTEYCEFSQPVSHVSGRFRHVSLRTPLLWTRFASGYTKDQIETHISRSGKLDLQVTLYDHPYGELRSFLRLMAPHSGRWSRLLLLLDTGHQDVINEFGLTNFPRLQFIHHRFEILPLGLQWSMPSLSHFDGFCAQFPPGVSFPFLSQLTCVELRFENYETCDMKSLAWVLYRMLNLRNLSLEFQNCDALDDDLEFTLETPKPRSFCIDSLKITFKEYVATDFVSSLYKILMYLTASLVDISVLTHMLGDSYDIWQYAAVFPFGYSLRLQFGSPCSLLFIDRLPTENCKTLQSLQFERSSFNNVSEALPTWSDFPSLHHIQFHDCVMLEEDCASMARSLLTHDDFQSLEIISCHRMSEQFLMDLQDEVGERLTWCL